MSFLDWSTIVGLVAISGFLWRLTHTLNRDVRKLETRVTGEINKLSGEIHKLGERVAKIEGSLFHPPAGSERKRQL